MGFPSSPEETGSSSYIHDSELKSFYERYRFIGSPSLGSSCFAKFEGKQSNWKGYSKTEFQVDGNTAFVVEPKACGGKPMGLAHVSTYHTEIDEMLLKDGYHIAHINTGSRLGSIHALKIWEQFYDLLTQKHGFNQRWYWKE